ncbi:hypothetical protein BD626DRAFT_479479 [Schizophyllum amplum]|uniref:Cyclin N-terminal domain-containing protein n=1 Tax=Schizophyllum amplum TaxID=97359 RepID=A0A550CSC6_9AGAR|nr:hypothetical protein BD626DRAFT_479479 [Auriculariopsis ampla]
MSAELAALPRHPASLIPIAKHNRELVRLLSRHVTPDMVEYVATRASELIQIDSEPTKSAITATPPHAALGTSSAERWQSSPRLSLRDFVLTLVRVSRVHVATLLTTLIYLERLSGKLPVSPERNWSAKHRIFLATLIVSAKYLNDSSPKNKHWASYSVIFSCPEINLMEQQLLFLLDYDLRFDEKTTLDVWAPFLSNYSQATRASAMDRVARGTHRRSQISTPYELSRPTFSRSSSAESASSKTSPEESLSEITKRLSIVSSSRSANRSSVASSQSRLVVPPPLVHSRSSASTASSGSSYMGSLIDDTGSSSGSSVWSSSDESDGETEPPVYTSASRMERGEGYHAVDEHPVSHSSKKPFLLRSVPSQACKDNDRSRKLSDAGSVRTITITPPQSARKASNSRHTSSAKRSSIAFAHGSIKDMAGINGMSRSSSSAGFLSRMWSAATKKDDVDHSPEAAAGHGLKRLMLVRQHPIGGHGREDV